MLFSPPSNRLIDIILVSFLRNRMTLSLGAQIVLALALFAERSIADVPVPTTEGQVVTVATVAADAEGVAYGIAVTDDGADLYVSSYADHVVRHVDTAIGVVSTIAGIEGTSGYADGVGTNALFWATTGIQCTGDGSTVYVTDKGNNRIRQIDTATKMVTTLAFSGQKSHADGVGTNAHIYKPGDMTMSTDESTLYVAEYIGSRIRQIDIASKTVTTLAGSGNNIVEDGIGTSASFHYPQGLAITPDDATLFVVDSRLLMRKIDLNTKAVTTVAGQNNACGNADGVGDAATISYTYQMG